MSHRDRTRQTDNMFQNPTTHPPIKITYKTPAEIEKMRVAGRLAAEVLDMIGPYVQEGVTTEELDRICHDYMVNVQQVIPAPLNYRGFPKSICTSVNHVVCHGIPGPKKLKKGDVVNLDITVIKDGYHGDTSRMFQIGTPPLAAQRVCQIAYECLCIGIRTVRPGLQLGDIAGAGLRFTGEELRKANMSLWSIPDANPDPVYDTVQWRYLVSYCVVAAASGISAVL